MLQKKMESNSIALSSSVNIRRHYTRIKECLELGVTLFFSSQHKKLPFPFELLRDMGISKLDSGQLSITCSYSSYITLSAS